jgi:ABC-type transport system involved in multi-copper enzyme maturation permease subunit
MFVLLLIVTFLVALGVSTVVVRMFTAPIERILSRIISDPISSEWVKYLKFAIYVVGISSGVRVWDLEKYITRPQTEFAEIVELTANRWVLEVYRTIISTLEGAAWLLLVFFIFALLAYVIVRVVEAREQRQALKPQ